MCVQFTPLWMQRWFSVPLDTWCQPGDAEGVGGLRDLRLLGKKPPMWFSLRSWYHLEQVSALCQVRTSVKSGLPILIKDFSRHCLWVST